MARRPRVEYPGAFFHVIARGNQRREVFHDRADRLVYLQKLQHYKDRYGFLLYAYTLMTNHVHLLIEINDVGLAKIIQGFHQSYTQYYNRRYKTAGHLFQGRYKAILCDRDSYLLQLVRYIHLNPVRAKIVSDPAVYPWSSHRAYLGREESRLVNVDLVLVLFSKKKGLARQKYNQFVLEECAGTSTL